MRPLLIVMEEAHRYLGPDSGSIAADVIKQIAKEGRKYGVGAMLVSQRPAEVDETVLSQCGTMIALRLSNPNDRAKLRERCLTIWQVLWTSCRFSGQAKRSLREKRLGFLLDAV